MITEFDEGLWCATLNTMVVKSDKEVVFHFKDGAKIPWELEQGEGICIKKYYKYISQEELSRNDFKVKSLRMRLEHIVPQ